MADYMKSSLAKIPGVETGTVPAWVTNHVPRIWVRWDEKAFNFSREECFKALQEGEPSVVALRTPMGVTLVPWMMDDNEEIIVAARVKAVLEKAKKTAGSRPVRSAEELAYLEMDNPVDVWGSAVV
jgi:hypothetical protein